MLFIPICDQNWLIQCYVHTFHYLLSTAESELITAKLYLGMSYWLILDALSWQFNRKLQSTCLFLKLISFYTPLDAFFNLCFPKAGLRVKSCQTVYHLSGFMQRWNVSRRSDRFLSFREALWGVTHPHLLSLLMLYRGLFASNYTETHYLEDGSAVTGTPNFTVCLLLFPSLISGSGLFCVPHRSQASAPTAGPLPRSSSDTLDVTVLILGWVMK